MGNCCASTRPLVNNESASQLRDALNSLATEGAITLGDGNDGHSDMIWAITASRDGLFILSGGEDETAILWDAKTGKVEKKFEDGHDSYIHDVALSADNL